MKATKSKAENVAADLEPLVNLLLVTMTAAQLERERVDKIQNRLINEQIYYGTDQVERGGPKIQIRITDIKRAWRMDDQSFKAYNGRCQAVHLADGFKEASDGKCPALVAEHLQREAEWVLIEYAEAKHFSGITNNALLCKHPGVETRKKYLDMLIGMIVNALSYKSPLP